ncbi:MAG: CbbQ/NirQ/NorQ/GpvN family protein [Gammaproteobacteria bacterium]|nr:CbbQ/NirQ/NorQ/GpvN family protein [Gammaproteobacteria bacterium]
MSSLGTTEEPYYLPIKDEVEIFQVAYEQRLPVLLKGPTGCGKTRFVEHMAWKLREQLGSESATTLPPLITVSCHEDLTSTDLVGRFLLRQDETYWQDGPLTTAVRHGSICYLDEIVEARKDTTVVIHSLTDHRRILHIEKTGEFLQAHPNFLLVISYNPGYQSILKDLKTSTRQRFASLVFDYPDPELEAQIIQHESGGTHEVAQKLAELGVRVRNLQEHGFEDGVSTRLLIYTSVLIHRGIDHNRAIDTAILQAVTDDADIQQAIRDVVDVSW